MGNILITNVNTGLSAPEIEDDVTAVSFSNSGNSFITGLYEEILCVWDIRPILAAQSDGGTALAGAGAGPIWPEVQFRQLDGPQVSIACPIIPNIVKRLRTEQHLLGGGLR